MTRKTNDGELLKEFIDLYLAKLKDNLSDARNLNNAVITFDVLRKDPPETENAKRKKYGLDESVKDAFNNEGNFIAGSPFSIAGEGTKSH